jgi:ABC-2 type transport system permease protein
LRGLLTVELRRLLARRIVRLAATLTILGLVLAGLVLFLRSHRPDAATAARLRSEAQTFYQQSLALCVSGQYGIQPQDLPPGTTLEQFCGKIVAPPSVPDGYHLARYQDVAKAISGLFIAVLVMVGATSAGAEWHAGTVTTQLTWEPRRAPLLVAKLLAVALVAFVAFWIAEALLFAAVLPAGLFRGTTQGIDATWVRLTLEALLRASAVAAMGAAIGHALAWTARNTAVAVGAVLGYAAVIEPLLHAIRPRWERWFLVDNAARFITAHPLDLQPLGVPQRSTAGAAILLLVYTTGLAAASLAVFRRRDVT